MIAQRYRRSAMVQAALRRRILPVMAERLPPQVPFVVSAVFHYLGPAFAVLLFARVDALGVAWLRIAAAAAVFALWRRPWRALAGLDAERPPAAAGLGRRPGRR